MADQESIFAVISKVCFVLCVPLEHALVHQDEPRDYACNETASHVKYIQHFVQHIT